MSYENSAISIVTSVLILQYPHEFRTDFQPLLSACLIYNGDHNSFGPAAWLENTIRALDLATSTRSSSIAVPLAISSSSAPGVNSSQTQDESSDNDGSQKQKQRWDIVRDPPRTALVAPAAADDKMVHIIIASPSVWSSVQIELNAVDSSRLEPSGIDY